MQKMCLGLVFILVGVLMIGGGVVAQIAWLGFCFGTVIIGLLMMFFAPSLLFLPFTILILSGMALWGRGFLIISGKDA